MAITKCFAPIDEDSSPRVTGDKGRESSRIQPCFDMKPESSRIQPYSDTMKPQGQGHATKDWRMKMRSVHRMTTTLPKHKQEIEHLDPQRDRRCKSKWQVSVDSRRRWLSSTQPHRLHTRRRCIRKGYASPASRSQSCPVTSGRSWQGCREECGATQPWRVEMMPRGSARIGDE